MRTAHWIRTASRRIPENSLAAYGLALGCVAIAAVLRMLFGLIGADLPFATNFVAVLLVALFAGPSAGGFAIALSLLVVWWAFIPPFWQFGPITFSDAANMAFFTVMSSAVVWIATSYRNLIHAIELHDVERELMVRELTHRGRNTFAVVDAIVRLTLDDLPDRAKVISDRVRAVSSTNDLINAAPAQRITLNALLAKEFAPHGPDRLHFRGEPVEIDSTLARSLALVFHELVTNATKYGALASKDGRVDVTCGVDGPDVTVNWRETGGPHVTAPTEYGFGARLLTRILKSISGTIKPDFRADGLVCEITFARQ